MFLLDKVESVCQIPDSLVEKSIETFKILKEKNFQFKEESCDKKAFRTKNILQYKTTRELASELLPYISPSLRPLTYPDNHEALAGEFFKKNRTKHLRFSSLHFIEYKKGGYQLPNKNDHLEEFSCKIYLNDSEVNSVNKINKNYKLITGSKKGRVLLFSSDTLVEEEKDITGERLILVGGLISDSFKPRFVINKPKSNLLKKWLKKIYFWKD